MKVETQILQVISLQKENQRLREENQALKERIAELEKSLGKNIRGVIAVYDKLGELSHFIRF